MTVASPPLGSIRNRLIPTSSTSDQWNSRVGRSQTGVATGGFVVIHELPGLDRNAASSGHRRAGCKRCPCGSAWTFGPRLGDQPAAEGEAVGSLGDRFR